MAILTFLSLFIKDLFLENSVYSLTQLGSIGGIMLIVLIILAKVWVPIIYDALELLGKHSQMPESIQYGGWFRWIIYGLIAFMIFALIGISMGIDLLNPESWIGPVEAGRILQFFMISVALIVVAVPEGLPMSVTLSFGT